MEKTRSNTFILEKEIVWEPAGEGVVRQIMGYDGQVMLVKVKFEQGAVGTPHTHYHTQTTYVASGKFEFTVNGEKQIVETGDGVLHRTGCGTWLCMPGSRYLDRLFQPHESRFSEALNPVCKELTSCGQKVNFLSTKN